MINSLLQSTTLPALEQAAVFAERRHEVLAGNMANLDTPGYRARDLSLSNFEKELAASIERQRNPEPTVYRSPGYANRPGSLREGTPAAYRSVAETPEPDLFAGPKLAMEKLVYHDGSDLNWETQVTELSKNQSLHNMAIALMRSQFSTLNAAISERV